MMISVPIDGVIGSAALQQQARTMGILDHLNSGRTRIEWLSQLNTEYTPAKQYRRTSIICTIGPKTNSAEKINALRKVGLNVVRMNFSHGSYEYHQSVIDHAREAEKSQPGRPLAIALDTKGPEIRTGNTVGDADIPIKAGAIINITTDEQYATSCDDKNMYVDYKNITKVIEAGRTIYVDDGVLSFEVLEIVDDKTLKCKCVNNGKISSRKGVNLPKTDIDLPPLSEKDKADLKFGVKNKVDMVFASFIRRGSDITAIREVLGEEGKDIQIIAKVENQQGVNNFDEILRETDGVMVARGDLGIEIPPSQVFIAQKMMITKCNIAGKPVICATQMLESMTYNPRPTRAEVSDVGNAVLDGADCVMLSGETAKGDYPVEAVTMMHETCLLAEVAIPYVNAFDELRKLAPVPCPTTETCAMAAVSASLEQNAGAILVLTTSGTTARLVSKYRPVCPIIMVTRNAMAARYSHLYRGVYPFYFPEAKPDFKTQPWQEDVDRRLKWGIMNAIKLGVLSKGDPVICVQGWRGGMGHTNTLRIVPAQEDLGLDQDALLVHDGEYIDPTHNPTTPSMDISALVNHDGDATVLPRRSLSIPHSTATSSPVTFAAKIPSPPPKTKFKQMSLKRKRHDPKPIWAYREGEELPPELKQLQEQQRQQSRPPPTVAQPQPHAQPPPQAHPQPRPQPSPMVERNGHPSSEKGAPPPGTAVRELSGFERPISNDAQIYDDVSRNVCDFIWNTAVNNEVVRSAIADPRVQLEVEARWGQIIDKQTDQRLRGFWRTETVLNTDVLEVKFESTMTAQQHKRMNLFLNAQVQQSKAPGAPRPPIDYRHTYETDMFYELDQQGFSSLNPIVQRLISTAGGRQRVRVTRDKNTGEFLRAIIKHRLGNLEVSSPKTEWDYRIGINLEIDFPGPIESLTPAVEGGKTAEGMHRQKDRMSYSWLGAYQVDLTQVSQGPSKNHELELELDSGVLIAEADKVRRKEPTKFESLINGMMNNLRVLSREITVSGPGPGPSA
ncbi:hypothetical protein BM1_00523 [Bipolaris maydis]|nr:hypothetical protein BM1_00523 [Bipolaris maydis]